MSQRQGDTGTWIELTISDEAGVVDVSTATTKEIHARKPSGTTVTWTAVFTTDGTDGKIRYQTLAATLDEVGTWVLQGHVVIGTWDGHSTKAIMTVEAAL
jgi:hypothetical protein